MDDIDPAELVSALSRIPLFREIRNVFTNQTRPVNWQMAGEIAEALASTGSDSVPDPASGQSDFAEACRLAQLRITALTGFELLPGVTRIEMLERQEWARATLKDLAPYVERLANRLTGQISPSVPVVPLQGLVGAMSPFLIGSHMGLIVGYLAHKSLGQWDLCLPRGAVGRINVNLVNVVKLEKELGVDPKQFRMWLAFNEVAHELLFQAIPWARPYLLKLIESYVDAVMVDSAEIMVRLQSMADPEQMNMLMQRPEELFPMLRSPEQNALQDRIQSFMSVSEGYAGWVVERASSELLNQFDRIREGINRRQATRSSAEKMLEKLLGLDLSLGHKRAGERFIRALEDAGQLELLWKGPENLPELNEVSEPAKWLTRVAFS
jgi:putative hydrolase